MVGDVIPDIGRGGDDDGQRLGIPARVGCGLLDRTDGPLGDLRVGQLQDEPVRMLSRRLQRLRSVGRHQDFRAGTGAGGRIERLHPGKMHGRAVVVHLLTADQRLDGVNCLAQFGQLAGLPADHPQGRVSSPDPADRSVAVHLVQRGEHRGRDGGISRPRIGDHRADRDGVGRRQNG